MNKIKSECLDLGIICEPEKILPEIEKYNDKYLEKGLIKFSSNRDALLDEEIDNTRGWYSISLINTTGRVEDWRDSGNSESIVKTKYLKETPILNDLVTEVEKKFDTKCIGARILKLEKNGYIGEHTDDIVGLPPEELCEERFRFEISLTDCPDCFFIVNDVSHTLKPGHIYYLNVSYKHKVINKNDKDRINIVLDFARTTKLKRIINELGVCDLNRSKGTQRTRLRRVKQNGG